MPSRSRRTSSERLAGPGQGEATPSEAAVTNYAVAFAVAPNLAGTDARARPSGPGAGGAGHGVGVRGSAQSVSAQSVSATGSAQSWSWVTSEVVVMPWATWGAANGIGRGAQIRTTVRHRAGQDNGTGGRCPLLRSRAGDAAPVGPDGLDDGADGRYGRFSRATGGFSTVHRPHLLPGSREPTWCGCPHRQCTPGVSGGRPRPPASRASPDLAIGPFGVSAVSYRSAPPPAPPFLQPLRVTSDDV